MKRVNELPVTRRLRVVLVDAARRSRSDGRWRVEVGDVEEALRLARRARWRPCPRVGSDRLTDGVLQWWRDAEHEAVLAGHPYLAPEHLLLVVAGPDERMRLLTQVGAFSGGRGWRPRGPRSAARRSGRELTAERQRQARATGRRDC